MTPLPLQFLRLILAGWVNRQQQETIEYLQGENRVLREHLSGKRLRFTDAQRCRLARRAKPIGRRALREISTVVTPDTEPFRANLESSGVVPVKFPSRSPNLNAYAERFVRSIKSECMAQVVPLGECHLRRAVREYVDHYHSERSHQGLGNELIEPDVANSCSNGPVECRERLGRLLRYYRRAA